MTNRMVRWAIALVVSTVLAALSSGARAAPAAGITYYSQGSLEPNTAANWNTARTGGGASPRNFTSGDIFIVQSGHTMTTSAQWSISGTGSKLWIENGGILTGTYPIILSTDTTFRIDAGGTYVHDQNGGFGGAIFQGTESFDPASIVILRQSNSTGPSDVTFGNLTIDFSTAQTVNVNCAGKLAAIAGDLTVRSTNTVNFRLSGATPYSLSIGRDLVITDGTLDTTYAAGANPTINIAGDFYQTGGTLKSSGSVTTLVFTGGASAATFTESGTLTNTNFNWQIASGKTVALTSNFGSGSLVASGRTITVNGAFQINQGAWPGSSGTWTYGPSGTLIFSNSSGSYGVGNDVYWPTTNGPANVTVAGAGGITMNVARTVSGVFQTAAGVTNANNLTLNGTAQINAGGYFSGSPTYGSASTLVYNTGASYGVSNEWAAGIAAGPGVPRNVTIQNNTTVNASASNRTVPGSLTITSGTLALNSSSGDLYVGGNWSNDGLFSANGRRVTFNGSSVQSIAGTASTAFDKVTINNQAGISLAHSLTVNNELQLWAGDLTTNANTVTLGPSSVVSAICNTADCGDVIGNVKRNQAYAEGVVYAFGNPYVTITFPSNVTTATPITVNLQKGAPPFTDASIKRLYTIDTLASGPAILQLHYTTADFNGSPTEGNLVLWRHEGSEWMPYTDSLTRDSSHHAVSATVPGFSEWAISDTGTPSAITLTAFSGQAAGIPLLPIALGLSGLAILCAVLIISLKRSDARKRDEILLRDLE